MTLQVTIYALRDPRDGEIRYVGQTQSPKTRIKAHFAVREKHLTPKAVWIEELARADLKPEVVVLEVVSADNANQAEQQWISKYNGGNQCRLLNVTARGVHNSRYRRTHKPLKQRGITISDELDQRVFEWGNEQGFNSWSEAARAILAQFFE